MIDLLLKQIKIIDSSSTHDGQRRNVYIHNGKIEKISSADIPIIEHTQVIEGNTLCLSPGWFDLRSVNTDPGAEHKEDLASLRSAAAFGGFTDVAVLPNTQPVMHSKDAVRYVQMHNPYTAVQIHPIAAVTKGTQGEELTEMIDLQKAGAVAFSDGIHALTNSATLKYALYYLQPINGLLMNFPYHQAVVDNGQMHEGNISTLVGMKAIPSLAEEMAIQHDLALLEYTNGRMHFSTISSAKSVQLIREAKAKGLQVSCDVAAYQMAFSDEDLLSFDTNLKVLPPFRSKADNTALWEGLADGTIDAVVSNHQPHDVECKNLEFDLADFGISSIETAFSVLNTYRPDFVSIQLLIEKMSNTPRVLLQQPAVCIEEGENACLTIFDTQSPWILENSNLRSKAENSPFIGKKLRGKVHGIINNNQFIDANSME